MLCSLCFKNKTNCIHLSCNHNVCLSCIPKQTPSQSILRYQCETCLAVQEIDLRQKIPVDYSYQRQFSKSSYFKGDYSSDNQCIFCWTCHEAITLNEYIKGCHRDHSVQAYQQAIPSIKTLLLQQLQKSSSLKDNLQENKQILQQNRLKQNYDGLLDRINEFFYKQIQIIEKRREKIVGEAEAAFSNCLKDVQKQVDILTPLIEDIESLGTKISQFVTDQIPVTEINPIREILFLVDEYSAKLKDRKFCVPELPQFICKSTVKEPIENACSLFYNKVNKQNTSNKVTINKTNFREEFYSFDNTKSTQNQAKNICKNNPDISIIPTIDKKVRLVQKVKGKMKYTSSMCSTSFT